MTEDGEKSCQWSKKLKVKNINNHYYGQAEKVGFS